MKLRARVVVLASALILAGAASAQGYRFDTLDPNQPYFTIIPFGINDSGVVSGVWSDVGQVDHGFIAAGGSFTSFDDPLADTTKVIAVRGTWAGGIDNTGTTFGVYSAGGSQHGFLRDAAGNFSTLDIAGHLHTALSARNASGQIIGQYADSNAVLGGTSFLRAADGTLTVIAMPASTFSEAEGLNDAGTIVGAYYDAANVLHGFSRAANGVFTTIDVAGADATILSGINDSGWITGEYDAGGVAHAFVRDPTGAVQTIDAPGATFASGTAINTLGVVTGQWCGSDNNCHGFVATPVPEPAGGALGLAGLALVGLRLHRSRR